MAKRRKSNSMQLNLLWVGGEQATEVLTQFCGSIQINFPDIDRACLICRLVKPGPGDSKF
jgi:hypothetical protein